MIETNSMKHITSIYKGRKGHTHFIIAMKKKKYENKFFVNFWGFKMSIAIYVHNQKDFVNFTNIKIKKKLNEFCKINLDEKRVAFLFVRTVLNFLCFCYVHQFIQQWYSGNFFSSIYSMKRSTFLININWWKKLAFIYNYIININYLVLPNLFTFIDC